MSITSEADYHVDRAKELVAQARKEIGEVLLNRKEMSGADDFKPGYIKNVFDRLDATQRALDGDDPEGNALAAMLPPP